MDQLEAQMMTLGTQAEACVPDSTAVVTPQHGTVASSSVGEPAKAGTVGIVYDAVMELHMREGQLLNSAGVLWRYRCANCRIWPVYDIHLSLVQGTPNIRTVFASSTTS